MARCRLSCPSRRQGPMDTPAIGGPAGRTGHRRPHQGRVCPPHVQHKGLNPWPPTPWVLPPHAHAACGGAMADGRAGDTRPDDPQRPPGGRDATSQPWGADTRRPSPPAPGPPERSADASARPGTATLGMVFAPWAGHRLVQVTARRTAIDVAHVLQAWVEEPSPQAEQLVWVMAHLNTHTWASLSEVCAPAEARRLTARLEMPDTPTHGRWLQMAATDRSVLATPCVARRLPDQTTRRQAVAAWA